MKKIIIALLIGSISLISNAQIKVTENTKPEKIGEYKQMGTLYVSIEKSGTTCTLTYRDDKFTMSDEYKSFDFPYSDLDTMYSLFTNFEGIEKGTEKTVSLEDGGKVYFKYEKMMGKMYAEVIHVDKALVGGKLRWMTEKQIKKLFGKNDK